MKSSFQDRVDAVFGALETSASHQAPTSWAVSQEQVYRAGKEANYSSDEEEQAKAAEAQRERLLPEGLLHFEGRQNEDDGQELPSHAFCKALDEEEDYDAHDAFASGVIDQKEERRPPGHTEVLEDNVFEVGSRARDAQGGDANAMEIDRPAPQPSHKETPAAAGPISTAEDGPSKAAKRVRFAVAEEETAGTSRSDVSGSRQAPRQGRRGGRSYVPDHVRNPQKYTAYVLEEPIVVGSGKAGSDNGRGENLRAAEAARAAATAFGLTDEAMAPTDEAMPPLELPSFGEGIAFNPRSQQRSAKLDAREASKAATDSSVAGATGDHLNPEEAGSHEMEVVAEEAAGGEQNTAEFASRTKRQRNLRSRGA